MAYIGKQPIVGNFQVCDAISVVNGQAAYTMQVSSTNVSPESANHMLVSLNGILQKPGSSFTISGSTITFASNLATGDVIDFIILLGNVLDLGTPSDSTVSIAKLTASGTASSSNFLRGDNSWAVPSGGKVGQVVSTTKTDTFTSNSQSYTDVTGLSVDITPSATSSKVLVFAKVSCGQPSGNGVHVQLVRGSTALLVGDTASNRTRSSSNIYSHSDANSGPIYGTIEVPILYLDSPSSTSSTTYKIQFKQSEDLTGCLNRSSDDTDAASRPRTASTITVMEVLA